MATTNTSTPESVLPTNEVKEEQNEATVKEAQNEVKEEQTNGAAVKEDIDMADETKETEDEIKDEDVGFGTF